MDARYESMYSSKQNKDNVPESQYEQLKVRQLAYKMLLGVYYPINPVGLAPWSEISYTKLQ